MRSVLVVLALAGLASTASSDPIRIDLLRDRTRHADANVRAAAAEQLALLRRSQIGINFISSATSADVLLASGNMPAFAPADLDAQLAKANLPAASQDAIKNGLSVIDEGSPVPFIDWGAPDLYDAIKSGFETLTGGSMSVDSFLDHLQGAYGPYVASLK